MLNSGTCNWAIWSLLEISIYCYWKSIIKMNIYFGTLDFIWHITIFTWYWLLSLVTEMREMPLCLFSWTSNYNFQSVLLYPTIQMREREVLLIQREKSKWLAWNQLKFFLCMGTIEGKKLKYGHYLGGQRCSRKYHDCQLASIKTESN